MTIITSYHQDKNAPSIPCIRDDTNSAAVRYIEVCDIEPGIEYNEERAQHPLATTLILVARVLLSHEREE